MLKLKGLGTDSGINRRETPEMVNFLNQLNQTKLHPELQIELSVTSLCSHSLQERYQKRQHNDQVWFKSNGEQFIEPADPPLEVSDNELSLMIRIQGTKSLINEIYPIADQNLRFSLPEAEIRFSCDSIGKLEELKTHEIIYLYPVETDQWQLYFEIPNQFLKESSAHLLKMLTLT